MIGGTGEKAWHRVARFGSGWTFAIGSPDDFATGARGVLEAWAAQGRAGKPRLAAQRYFSLGGSRRQAADQFLRSYFAFLGPFVDPFITATPLDAEAVGAVAEAFRQRRADELAFLPTSTDVDELEQLAGLLARHEVLTGNGSN
jgi:alkanesulfonate monooxygenase SsuD/methylene tetrahydromethanopterin reductase-like flavin-dependent oxidoreductase (luciferase family)